MVNLLKLIKSNSSNTVDKEKPTMAHLETLEAKMASIEVSLSSSNTPRRRKGTSLGGGGSISARASPRPPSVDLMMPSKEHRSAMQDREAVIQSLRLQLGLGKLPRPMGTPLDETERPAAEQRLTRLKIDSDNKRVAIRNLKSALDKLDITDNIDVRIRQAELEYALGREELHLLSLVEETRALQSRMDKSKPDANTLFSTIQSGTALVLYAVQASVGRWAACAKTDSPGLWIEWALDGEGLYRGDRILEVNGQFLVCKTREELQKIIGITGKCQLVVVRKRTTHVQHHQLVQSQEDNQRLQHRISYLEDQVKDLLSSTKDSGSPVINGKGGSHVTSISISSPHPTSPNGTLAAAEKPQIFQRGNFVTTIIGGKPMECPPATHKTHITKTIIKDLAHQNGVSRSHMVNGTSENNIAHTKTMSASKISINSDITHMKRERHREKELQRRDEQQHRDGGSRHHQNGINGHHTINNGQPTSRVNGRYSDAGPHYAGYTSYARSVEHLNYTNGHTDRRKESSIPEQQQQQQQQTLGRLQRSTTTDMRSVKSLDFDSDAGDRKHDVDYTSEPVAHRVRPTPPKKPLRLSLQRAQSLQTVEANISESDKKRAMKRTYKGKSPEMLQYIENNVPLQTSSLGRHNHI